MRFRQAQTGVAGAADEAPADAQYMPPIVVVNDSVGIARELATQHRAAHGDLAALYKDYEEGRIDVDGQPDSDPAAFDENKHYYAIAQTIRQHFYAGADSHLEKFEARFRAEREEAEELRQEAFRSGLKKVSYALSSPAMSSTLVSAYFQGRRAYNNALEEVNQLTRVFEERRDARGSHLREDALRAYLQQTKVAALADEVLARRKLLIAHLDQDTFWIGLNDLLDRRAPDLLIGHRELGNLLDYCLENPAGKEGAVFLDHGDYTALQDRNYDLLKDFLHAIRAGERSPMLFPATDEAVDSVCTDTDAELPPGCVPFDADEYRDWIDSLKDEHGQEDPAQTQQAHDAIDGLIQRFVPRDDPFRQEDAESRDDYAGQLGVITRAAAFLEKTTAAALAPLLPGSILKLKQEAQALAGQSGELSDADRTRRAEVERRYTLLQERAQRDATLLQQLRHNLRESLPFLNDANGQREIAQHSMDAAQHQAQEADLRTQRALEADRHAEAVLRADSRRHDAAERVRNLDAARAALDADLQAVAEQQRVALTAFDAAAEQAQKSSRLLQEGLIDYAALRQRTEAVKHALDGRQRAHQDATRRLNAVADETDKARLLREQTRRELQTAQRVHIELVTLDRSLRQSLRQIDAEQRRLQQDIGRREQELARTRQELQTAEQDLRHAQSSPEQAAVRRNPLALLSEQHDTRRPTAMIVTVYHRYIELTDSIDPSRGVYVSNTHIVINPVREQARLNARIDEHRAFDAEGARQARFWVAGQENGTVALAPALTNAPALHELRAKAHAQQQALDSLRGQDATLSGDRQRYLAWRRDTVRRLQANESRLSDAEAAHLDAEKRLTAARRQERAQRQRVNNLAQHEQRIQRQLRQLEAEASRAAPKVLAAEAQAQQAAARQAERQAQHARLVAEREQIHAERQAVQREHADAERELRAAEQAQRDAARQAQQAQQDAAQPTRAPATASDATPEQMRLSADDLNQGIDELIQDKKVQQSVRSNARWHGGFVVGV
ncbi:hypothetical protein CAI21_22355, partial [Alkalilimnicola ehrlichii]